MAAKPPGIAAKGGEKCCVSNRKNAARTCKKLPVASFCASKTAETGRIANGCEQGDHVSRRQESYKGFLPYFLYFTKSRKIAAAGRRTVAAGNKKVGIADDNSRGAAELVAATTRKKSPQGGAKAAERQKDLILLVGSRHCGELN